MKIIVCAFNKERVGPSVSTQCEISRSPVAAVQGSNHICRAQSSSPGRTGRGRTSLTWDGGGAAAGTDRGFPSAESCLYVAAGSGFTGDGKLTFSTCPPSITLCVAAACHEAACCCCPAIQMQSRSGNRAQHSKASKLGHYQLLAFTFG